MKFFIRQIVLVLLDALLYIKIYTMKDLLLYKIVHTQNLLIKLLIWGIINNVVILLC